MNKLSPILSRLTLLLRIRKSARIASKSAKMQMEQASSRASAAPQKITAPDDDTPTQKPAKPQPSFDEIFPHDILTFILKKVHGRDLLNLLMSSKRLHCIALPMYIARCKDVYKNGELMLATSKSQILPALRLTFLLKSLEKVSCPVNALSPTAKRLQGLSQLFLQMDHVTEVSLDGGLPNWMFPLPQEEAVAVNNALSRLLDALHEKHCKSLTLNCWDSSLPVDSPPRAPTALEFLTCRSLTLFFSTFRSWTIETLNTSRITELTLTEYLLPSSYWTSILPFFSSRTLTNLVINTQNLKSKDLSAFLIRHPQIVELVLIQPLLFPASSSGMPVKALPNVTTLMVHAKNVSHILALPRSCPKMTELAIGLENPRVEEQAEEELATDLASMHNSMMTIAQRGKSVRLVLSFATGPQIVNWLILGGRPGKKRNDVEATLKHVTDLVVRPAKSLTDVRKIEHLLFQWLRIFPSLKTCEVYNLLRPDDSMRGGFLGAMAETFPQMEYVIIDNTRYGM